jgi:hypothetical protein
MILKPASPADNHSKPYNGESLLDEDRNSLWVISIYKSPSLILWLPDTQIQWLVYFLVDDLK